MNNDYVKQLNEMIRLLPSTSDLQRVSLKELFEKVSDEFWFWLLSEGYKENSMLEYLLPAMPDEKTQAKFTGRSGHAALEQAFVAYKLFKKIAEENGRDLSKCTNVLDFGCGWGRIIRFFLKDIEASGLYGVDCQENIISLCRQSNLRCNFELINTMPPIHYQDNKFDIIYLYSVFSHLSEEAHLKWLLEFNRILKPGGIIIATTRPREFILHCETLRKKQDNKDWQKGASNAFPNTEQTLSDYDKGMFCYSATGGGGILHSSFFGNACIPKKYVEENWMKYYCHVDYIYAKEHKGLGQDVIVGRKGE